MSNSPLRLLAAGALAAAALAATATPAAAVPCWKVYLTEHLLYDGPPGPDVWIMVPTIDMTDCF